MADQFDEFLQDIEHEIRQERYKKLWEQYGKYVAGVFVGLVLTVVGYNFWQSYQTAKAEKVATQFMGAQELMLKGKLTEAIGALNLVEKEGHKGYQLLSQFLKAAALIHQGKEQGRAEALEIYASLSEQARQIPFLRDAATILEAYLVVDKSKKEELDTILAKIVPLTGETHPLRFLAMEVKAIILYEKGSLQEALETFNSILRSSQAPEGIMMRAQLMSQVLLSKLDPSEKSL